MNQQPGWGAYPQQQPPGAYGYTPPNAAKKGSSGGLVLMAVIAIIVVAAGVMALLTKGSFDFSSMGSSSATKPPASTTPAPAPTPAPTPVDNTPMQPQAIDIKVTVKELLGAFQANEATADAKYRSKTIQVTGVISSVNPVTPSVLISAAGGPDDNGARCAFTSLDTEVIEALKPGATLTIQGNVISYNLDVLLTDCLIISK
jgi:hypothetical protein